MYSYFPWGKIESFLWALVFHYFLKNIADVFKICVVYNGPLFSLMFLGVHYIFTDPIQHLLCFFKLKIHQSLVMEIRPHSLWREPVPFLCLLILENACFMSVWQSHHFTCLWRLLSLFFWPSVVLKPRCSSWWSFPSGMPWPFWHTGLCIFIRIHFPKCIWCFIESELLEAKVRRVLVYTVLLVIGNGSAWSSLLWLLKYVPPTTNISLQSHASSHYWMRIIFPIIEWVGSFLKKKNIIQGRSKKVSWFTGILEASSEKSLIPLSISHWYQLCLCSRLVKPVCDWQQAPESRSSYVSDLALPSLSWPLSLATESILAHSPSQLSHTHSPTACFSLFFSLDLLIYF